MTIRSIDFDGKTYTVTSKGKVAGEGGWKVNAYCIQCGEICFEDLLIPPGRSIVDHLVRIGGPQSAPKRRGRPPKGDRSMSNAERQKAFQAKRRIAVERLEKASSRFAELDRIAKRLKSEAQAHPDLKDLTHRLELTAAQLRQIFCEE